MLTIWFKDKHELFTASVVANLEGKRFAYSPTIYLAVNTTWLTSLS